jgi:spore coat protein U-like protein
MGYHDSLTENAPVDGVWLNIADGVLTGKTSTNSTSSTTGSSYNLEQNKWYRGKVVLNADASEATFTLYVDDSDTVLWTDTLSTNIPKATGRETNHADVCTYSGTSAIEIGSIDYVRARFSGSRKVA